MAVERDGLPLGDDQVGRVLQDDRWGVLLPSRRVRGMRQSVRGAEVIWNNKTQQSQSAVLRDEKRNYDMNVSTPKHLSEVTLRGEPDCYDTFCSPLFLLITETFIEKRIKP